MRDPARIDRIMGMLTELWHRTPDQRLGQFLINMGLSADENTIWHCEDDRWESELSAVVEKRK